MHFFNTIRQCKDKYLVTLYVGKIDESPTKVRATLVDADEIPHVLDNIKLD